MRRLLRGMTWTVLGVLAGYGLLWLVMADAVVDIFCGGQIGVVQSDALHDEKAERWLEAAHRYHYLAEYGFGARKGVCADDWNQGTRQLPLVAIAMRLGGWTPTPELQQFGHDHARERYRATLSRSALPTAQPSNAAR